MAGSRPGKGVAVSQKRFPSSAGSALGSTRPPLAGAEPGSEPGPATALRGGLRPSKPVAIPVSAGHAGGRLW